MIVLVACIAAIAGFLFGFDEGVIAGAEESLSATFPMSPSLKGFMTAAVPLGALIGAFAAGRLANMLGRRRILIVAAIAFTVGSILAGAAGNLELLILARIILGLAIGVAGMVAPLYISETADAKRRGALVATYQLAITLGIVSAYAVGYVLAEGGHWRWMFASGAVPAVALLLGALRLPESPRWLALKGDMEKVRASLMRLRSNDTAAVEQEMTDMQAVSVGEHKSRWHDLFARSVRPAVIAALGLYVLQQLSGINAVIYYAPIIFADAGVDSSSTALLATVGVGVINVAFTVVSMWLIDRLGRRSLLIGGTIGTALSLATLAIAVAWDGPGSDYIAIGALFVYITAFAISLGPIPHIMMSEVFPLALRGQGMATASVINWGSNFLVVLMFPIALSAVGISWVMGFFGVVCALGLLFSLRYVPE
ncbi:MAG: sugar porter family MFS transporter, partial [Rhodospirillaceae bacterium]|nr:sugar porter family MFS transporter [Rhodospirillaceae bacterium]